jgi:hypothetical protein
MAEEVTDVNAEIETDIFADEVEPTTPEESSTEDAKTEEPEVESGDAEEQPDEAKESEDAPQPEATPRTAEARKEQLNNEIRELVSKRNDLRREVEAKNADVYHVPSADELMEQGMEPALARVESLEQRQQLAEFNAQVTDLNANLSVESLQVMNDYPVFNPEAPEYDKSLADRAASVYQRAAGIQTDPQTGLVVQANVLPYEIYKAFAETHQASIQSGQVNGQRAAEKMLAQVDTPSVATPKAPKSDPLLELWKD